MVVLLHTAESQNAAEHIAADIRKCFGGHVSVALNLASSPEPWPGGPAWDDLLIVLFERASYPDAGNDFIAEYLNHSGDAAMLLPVALNLAHRSPPRAANAIKALQYDESASGESGRLMNRVGGMLGLRVQNRHNSIFISYRAVDGSSIAKQLHEHLKALGYRVWMDEAKEIDGEPTILPGSVVQTEIDEALATANLVLLLDTPAAPESTWIQREIATANSFLLPVLPLCFRAANENRKGPRFRSLLDLQRWVALTTPFDVEPDPLSTDELTTIVGEMEQYLCEIFRRKCRVPFIVQKEFVSRDFAWSVLDHKLLMFRGVKKHSVRLVTKVLSHCSVFDQVHSPALKRFADYLGQCERCNHSLFIYDGDLLPEPELQEILQDQSEPVTILHHQELAALLDSNFSSLAA